MKSQKYVAIFGLFMSINFCNVQTDAMATRTMLEEFNLKGKVKTVTYEFGSNFDRGRSEKLYFDEIGMLVKQESCLPERNINIMYDNYVYANGKLISFNVFIERNFFEQNLFEYDTLGLVISSNLNGIKVTYKYNELRNRIEDNGYLFMIKYKYNAKGQVVEEWEHEILSKTFEYNEFGDVISITNVHNDITTTITLIYDDAGNWVKRITNGTDSYYYRTTEQIYTGISYYAEKNIRRIIEYYE